MITTVSYFKVLRNFDAIGKFSASGTTRVQLKMSSMQRNTWIEIRKLEISFAPRCQWTRGNLPVC